MSDLRSAVLELDNVSVSFGKASVLRGSSFTLERGECAGIVGQNGSGKSTLVKAIIGAVTPSSGSIRYNGTPAPSSTVASSRAGIALVPQGRQLLKGLTVEENLKFGAFALGRKWSGMAELEPVFELFPRIESLMDRKAGLLSGGEQQMVAIGRALVTEPSLMIIDELSLGLAPVVVNAVWSAIRTLRERRGMSLLVIDQNLSLIDANCQSVYLLGDGRLRNVTGDHELLSAPLF